jgi:DNA-binding transcriptional LysR family regulator
MASIVSADGLDISSVRLFLDVVELGSVSKAAVRQRLAQPSATAKLQKLERQLGVQLLDRAPTGSVPTAAGRRLAPACAEVLAAAVGLLDRAATVVTEQNRLLVAATRHVAEHFLPGWIEATDLTDIDVELVEDDTLGVAQLVRAGGADLGFTDGPFAPLGLRSDVIVEEEVVAVVGNRHPWYGRSRRVTGNELVAATLALPRPGSGTRDVVLTALAPFRAGESGDRIEVSGAAGARVVASTGRAVAFLPRCLVGGELDRGGLSVLALRDIVIAQPVRAVWRSGQPPRGAPRRLLATARR